MAYKRPLWRSVPRPGEMRMITAPAPPGYITPQPKRRRRRRFVHQGPPIIYGSHQTIESPGEREVRRQLFVGVPSATLEIEEPIHDVAERAVVFPNVIRQGQTFRRPIFESRINLGQGYNRELDTSVDEDARSRFFANMARTRNTFRARLNAREHAERVQLSNQLKRIQKHRRKFLADVAGLVRPEPIEVEEPYDDYCYEPEEYGDYEQDYANTSSGYMVEEPESEARNLSGRSSLNESLKPRRLFH